MPLATADEIALIREIRANPDDDFPRLVAADLFEDAGDVKRAAYIRYEVKSGLVQIQEYPDSPGWTWYWRRGFVERVACPLDHWIALAPDVLRMHPLAWVGLSDRQPMSIPGGKFAWGIEEGDTVPWRLPGAIGCRFVNPAPYWEWPTEKAAITALSAACLLYAEMLLAEED